MFISKKLRLSYANLSISTILMSFLIGISPVSAGVPDGLHYMVSPVSCYPKGSADEVKLKYVNGAWVFKSNQDNTYAYLVCPISFYGNVGYFNNLQLWYKDPDGSSGKFQVNAKLMSRHRSAAGAIQIASVYSSNGNSDGYSHTNLDLSGWTLGPVTGRNYFLQVYMYRNTSDGPGNVAFTGFAIDID